MTEATVVVDPSPLLPAAPFDAILYPHRSLPPLGFAILMGAVVGGERRNRRRLLPDRRLAGDRFFGLDVLLLWLAFRWNYRQGRRAELIRLDRQGLIVRRIEPSGRHREWRFEPYWVRVTMDDPPRPDSQLTLGSHAQHLVIGAFLTPEERLEVAQALRAALRDQQNAA